MGNAEEYRMSEKRRALLRVLEETGEAMSPNEVVDAMGKPRNTVKQRLWRMAQDGQLLNQGGRYAITEQPKRRIVVIRIRRLSIIPGRASPFSASMAIKRARAAICATPNTRLGRKRNARRDKTTRTTSRRHNGGCKHKALERGFRILKERGMSIHKETDTRGEGA